MYQMIFAVPLFIIGAFLWDRPMVFHPDTRVLGALLYQSVVTAAFGFLAWIHLLQRYGTVALHSFVFIMPIAGVVLGGLVLNEPITGKILLALGFIVFGIFIIHFKTKKRIIPITFYKG
jgi:drug/metabolite transporter (DMT)-like permease